MSPETDAAFFSLIAWIKNEAGHEALKGFLGNGYRMRRMIFRPATQMRNTGPSSGVHQVEQGLDVVIVEGTPVPQIEPRHKGV